MIKKIMQKLLPKKSKASQKSVVHFFTNTPLKEREGVLKQAIRQSNQDQKKILDYYRSRAR